MAELNQLASKIPVVFGRMLLPNNHRIINGLSLEDEECQANEWATTQQDCAPGSKRGQNTSSTMLHSIVDFEVKNDFVSHSFFSISLSGDGGETQGLSHARPVLYHGAAVKPKLGFLSHLTWSLLPLKLLSHRYDILFKISTWSQFIFRCSK